MLEGVLGCEWKVLEVRHVGRGRDSKGAGESMEPADMVSKSGVHGSRYGFVVFMKVTRQCEYRNSRAQDGTYHFLGYPSR